MKKIFLAVAITMLTVVLLAGCGGEPTSTEPAAPTSQTEAEQAEVEASGKIGDYAVAIKNYEITTSYDGQQAILIFFDFTNNSDEPTSFWVAANVDVYQNGVELDTCSVINDQYDTTTIDSKNIQTGATLEVYQAWVLSNTTDPVDVIAEEFLGFTDDKVEKTFTLQ